MANKKTQSKKIISRGQISPVLVVGALLVIVIVFAGWIYLDNRNEATNTEEVPTGVQNPLEALPSPDGSPNYAIPVTP